MKILTLETLPFSDQQPGTSGLRKKTAVFEQPQYVENFIQAIFNANPRLKGGLLVVGGDGRYYNDKVIQKIIKMAIAFDVRRVIVGKDGILSTPTASHLIRSRHAEGGIILSASHNPGGKTEDFGIKFNTKNGGPAVEDVTNAIFEKAKTVSMFAIADIPDFDINTVSQTVSGQTTVEITDSTISYADLMEELFDFKKIKSYIKEHDFSLKFNGMHAVTGPYAREIFVNRLGLDDSCLMNAEALEDFGGGHPDPNPTYAKELINIMNQQDGPNFGAASDGDGDRNMIVGNNIVVSPSDSLAVLCANAKHLGLDICGVARSMPTSPAVDRVAKALGIECYVTPTGWKFFGSLLDDKKINLCGEESYGTGSSHVREKDGLWTVLSWLSVLVSRDVSVADLMQEHWEQFGRDYFLRNDYEGLSTEDGNKIYNGLRNNLKELEEFSEGNNKVSKAYVFDYVDPINGAEAKNQGVIIELGDKARIVFRLSGTGTSGATLRVYVSAYDDSELNSSPDEKLKQLSNIASKLAKIEEITGKTSPDVCVF